MTRTMFQEQLAQLDASMQEMAECVERSLTYARAVLEEGSIADHEAIYMMEFDTSRCAHEVEVQCLRILLRQQPVAGDLRETSGDLRAVTDFKRIADLGLEMCRTIDEMDGALADLRRTLLLPMMEKVQSMVLMAMDSYFEHDLGEAVDAAQLDDEVDDDLTEARNAVVAHLTEGEVDPTAAVSLLMAAKYLERMGDHAENVADWTGFLEG